MRLYLSSFRLGTDPTWLVRLAGEGARTAVIANAVDAEPPDVRREKVRAEVDALTGLGLRPFELDLREHAGAGGPAVGAVLAGCDAVWVRGGNVFVLRHVLARSGADDVLTELLRSDRIVYAGYSAGPCVLGPSLRGLEAVDDAAAVQRLYGAAPTWSGLGVLTERVVPHVRSPGHPGSPALDRIAERYRREGIPHLPLRDGEALVIRDDVRTIVGRPAG
ncbi:Type 1 glutamine amidotransferase-like domain-containing protein [Candidatus Blastococcus massiliensis]|uniref:Type 1 glutamine amidotransferase-like domain-containing protein n=1 Tax=Candidatus Blastococcus massiliensis TaxID=1470358 RepID=UPI0004B1EFE8|nr:Type 1 glutamine amidotransferase-like domain-containing protein [Candidatus Blastococcus massiliensis]